MACYVCAFDKLQVWYAILAALDYVAQGEPVPTDPQVLAEASKCYVCAFSSGMLPYAILERIAAITGGGGGGGTIQVYENRDPAPPDDPTKAAISEPTGGGTLTFWSPSSAAWV